MKPALLTLFSIVLIINTICWVLNYHMNISMVTLILISLYIIIKGSVDILKDKSVHSEISKGIGKIRESIILNDEITHDKKSFLKIKLDFIESYFAVRCLTDMKSFRTNRYNADSEINTFMSIIEMSVNMCSNKWISEGYNVSFISKFNTLHNENTRILLNAVTNNIKNIELEPEERMEQFMQLIMDILIISIDDFIEITKNLESEKKDRPEITNTSKIILDNNKIYTEISIMLDNKRLGMLSDPVLSKYLTMLVWVENIDHKVMIVNDAMGTEHIDKERIPSENIIVVSEFEDRSAVVKYIEVDDDGDKLEYIGIRQFVENDNMLKEPYFVYYCMPSR